MKKLFIFLVIFFVSPLWAQGPIELDSNQPIEISADSLEVLQDTSKAVFNGNVEALQGNIKMNAQRMEVFYRQQDQQNTTANIGAVSRIEVIGDVMFTTPTETAKATKGIYDVDKQMITLVGNVILSRDKNTLKGGRLDYNLKTQKSLLTSGTGQKSVDGKVSPSSGRVKGVFVPKQ